MRLVLVEAAVILVISVVLLIIGELFGRESYGGDE